MSTVDVNFDGLVGPTHNYGGLSFGNIASMQHKNLVSNPKEAALQGLNKMWELAKRGVKQGVFPPHERPYLPLLRTLGFSGTDEEVLQKAFHQAKELAIACCSASSMWAANAATVSASSDTTDFKVHFTPANLTHMLHRSLESRTTGKILRAIFANEKTFVHHEPLPPSDGLSDEGAANHMRFFSDDEAVEVFVFGKYALGKFRPQPKKYPARQTFEASQTIARRHNLKKALFVQQHPDAIDSGAFHNDVVAVNFENFLFFHERAYLNKEPFLEQLPVKLLEVKEDEVPLQTAISTYLFNSQLVRTGEGKLLMLSPTECEDNPKTRNYLKEHFDEVLFLNLKQSMLNGGGPACMRLRVPLTENEMKGVNPFCMLDEKLYEKLKKWIKTHYRDRLTVDDLADPQLIHESQEALDDVCHILNLGHIYAFQQF